MKLTTGYEFQGYYITEYVDVIFDEMLVGLGLGKYLLSAFDNAFSALTGREATEMIDKLNRVKQQLRDRVIKKARDLGANALIGIDFESSKLGDLMMVSMTATAVKIDKIVSPLPYTQTEQNRDNEIAAKEKKLEERKQWLEAVRKEPDTFSPKYFWETLKDCQTTKEMIDSVEDAAILHQEAFPDAVVDKVRGCLQLERMFGKGTGRQNVLNIIKEHFDL